MASADNENFWNTSTLSSSSFFEDEDDPIFTDVDVFPKSNTILPIHSIISNQGLSNILDDVKPVVEHVDTPPSETITKMFFEEVESSVLWTYRTLDEKTSLLDSALDIGDGYIITTVIVFLKKTLKSNIFLNILSTRKVALRHYVNYIIDRNDLEALANIYMVTGNINNLKDIYYILSRDITNQAMLLKRLEQFNQDHAQNLYSADDRSEIVENISLIGWQTAEKFSNSSLVQTLNKFCMTEWIARNRNEPIFNFKAKFKIDDFQYEWVVMNALCKAQKWDQFVNSFIKPMWVIKKKTLKTVISPEIFVINLAKYKPPKDVAEQFLSCINDAGRYPEFAERLGLKSYVNEPKDRVRS